MEDREIIKLFWDRSESAIPETMKKFHPYCMHIAYRILGNTQDAEECLNDIWMKAWDNIPPHRPDNLATFLGKLTRSTAIDVYRKNTAKSRGGGETNLALAELAECVPDVWNVEQEVEARELSGLLNAFLLTLPETERSIFVCRYWYTESIREIAKRARFREEKVKSMLFRTRNKLREYLKEAGYYAEK